MEDGWFIAGGFKEIYAVPPILAGVSWQFKETMTVNARVEMFVEAMD